MQALNVLGRRMESCSIFPAVRQALQAVQQSKMIALFFPGKVTRKKQQRKSGQRGRGAGRGAAHDSLGAV